jgi:regulator of replication initiation timing
MAEEQIAQLQQQNAALAKQLRETLEENAKLKAAPHAEATQETAQPSN